MGGGRKQKKLKENEDGDGCGGREGREKRSRRPSNALTWSILPNKGSAAQSEEPFLAFPESLTSFHPVTVCKCGQMPPELGPRD